MPYSSLSDLPDRVSDKTLPTPAQEIFKEAYNSAWSEYADAESRCGDDSQEEVANKVAWAAVKRKYEKSNVARWQNKE